MTLTKTFLKPAALALFLLGAPACNAQADRLADAPATTAVKADMTKATSALSPATQAYADVLRRGLVPGDDGILLFDYASAHTNGDHAKIKAFIAEQAQATPSAMGRDAALAYWANLYNAVTLDVVLDDYPVKSIRKLGSFNSGPWDREVLQVEGESLSLNDMEHTKMRGQYPTPYIHYMVNCASIGCPNVRRSLWQASTLDADSKLAAADYINADRGLTVNGKTLSVSKIYKWYSEDFGTEADFREHLATYATGDRLRALQAGAKFKGSHYDWDLNAVR